MPLLVSLLSGLIFGLGLGLSGMTHAQKVLDFLDLAGNWDPSLLFVLGGAVSVTVVAFHFVLKRDKPVFATGFDLPLRKHLDAPLLIGAAVFGIGWGISGYCPGPAIALLAAPNQEAWIFIPAMLAGACLHRLWSALQRKATVGDEKE
ncbi:DUF6691 family protein [Undibacterium sp. SXout7W]|uniref:DUF6691 family protein n=1 Tax=Undibacterium sp. SXout7W TaxID=3413049 RepID=UPI003BF21A91